MVEIDHIDRNKQNNHNTNLRWITPSNNTRNRGKFQNKSSRFQGVNYRKCCKKYIARVSINGKEKYFGRFDTEEEAALAWNEGITKLNLQEFYTLNVIN